MNRKSLAGLLLLASLSLPVPAAAQSQAPSPDEIRAMIRKAMGDALVQMLKPGPQQANWNNGGADIRAALASRPGGAAANYLVTTDKDGEAAVTIFTTEPAARFVPADWQPISAQGNVDAAAPGSTLEFGNLEGPYFFVGRVAAKRVGDAWCTGAPTGAQLYRVPGSDRTTDMPPEVIQFMFEVVTDMLAKHVICERHYPEGAGYRVRYFFEDGSTIPAMDSQNDRTAIVPARPVMELLKTKAG